MCQPVFKDSGLSELVELKKRVLSELVELQKMMPSEKAKKA